MQNSKTKTGENYINKIHDKFKSIVSKSVILEIENKTSKAKIYRDRAKKLYNHLNFIISA